MWEIADFKRHDLVYVSPKGRQHCYEYIMNHLPPCAQAWPEQELRRLVLPGTSEVEIPAIVRRQEEAAPGILQIGLASPLRKEGSRLRLAGEVPLDTVLTRKTPQEVAQLWQETDSPYDKLVSRVLGLGSKYGLRLGLFGAAALKAVTGLPYCHQDSDLDLLVCYDNGALLADFHQELCLLEQQSGVRIDAELELAEGYGIKLKEFFDSGAFVLAKGYNNVCSLSKEQVATMLQV